MEQYNGEDFHYIVSYRPLNDDSASDIKVRVNAPQRADAFEDKMSYSVPKQPTFQPYEISVEAANSLGSATSSLDRYKGYSGQDVPSLSPENFNVDHTSITAKNATFTWTGIDENDERIKGFFIGYKVRNN
jgi:neuronal cell adhesion protein